MKFQLSKVKAFNDILDKITSFTSRAPVYKQQAANKKT